MLTLNRYNINFRINNSITPGTPSIPTIRALNGLIIIFNPKNPAIMLNTNNRTPPIIAFINSLIKNFNGITNKSPIIYNATSPAKNANKEATDKSIESSSFY